MTSLSNNILKIRTIRHENPSGVNRSLLLYLFLRNMSVIIHAHSDILCKSFGHLKAVNMQLYIKGKHMIDKNSLLLKIEVAIFGYAKVCKYDGLEFYAFRCHFHGLVVDHAHGHNDKKYLCCNYCYYGH